jgi:ribosylpyrimidine nucleosidase
MEKIILDVDTGLDDMVALLFAAGSPSLEMLAVVATSGNQTIEHTLPNTRNVLSYLGRNDIPVYAGSHGPLLRKQVTGGHIHGTDGLGDIPFPVYPVKEEKERGVDAIIRLIMENPGEVTLVPTGPLTDVALAIRLEPEIIKNAKEIVCMGGSLTHGNITPFAEFNFYADPEAARIVLSSGAPVTLAPLDVTTQITLDRKRLDAFETHHGKAHDLFAKGMEFYTNTCLHMIRECPAMHDPCCIAYLLDKGIFKGEGHTLTIDTDETKETYGKVIDKGEGKTNVLLHADPSRFWPLLEKALTAQD